MIDIPVMMEKEALTVLVACWFPQASSCALCFEKTLAQIGWILMLKTQCQQQLPAAKWLPIVCLYEKTYVIYQL